MLSDAVLSSPKPSNPVTPKTKHKKKAIPECASAPTFSLEVDAVPVAAAAAFPNTATKATQKKHRQKYSSVELSAARELKGWSAPATSAAAAAVPLTRIMREQQDLEKEGKRVQLRDSVWQQVRALGKVARDCVRPTSCSAALSL